MLTLNTTGPWAIVWLGDRSLGEKWAWRTWHRIQRTVIASGGEAGNWIFFNIPKRENRETKRKENRKLDISFNMKYFVMKILQLSKEKEKKRFMLVKLADSPGHLHVHRPLKITQRNPLRWKYKTFSNKMRENVREIRKLFNWWTACYFPY